MIPGTEAGTTTTLRRRESQVKINLGQWVVHHLKGCRVHRLGLQFLVNISQHRNFSGMWLLLHADGTLDDGELSSFKKPVSAMAAVAIGGSGG